MTATAAAGEVVVVEGEGSADDPCFELRVHERETASVGVAEVGTCQIEVQQS